jgi:hypothetical protein
MFCFIPNWFNASKVTSLEIGKDETVYIVRSKITLINTGEKRTKIEIEGRYRKFWFIGTTNLECGNYVELHYRLFLINNHHKQVWITKIRKLTPVFNT